MEDLALAGHRPADHRLHRADVARCVEGRDPGVELGRGAVRAQHPTDQHPARLVGHREQRARDRLALGDLREAEVGVRRRLRAGVRRCGELAEPAGREPLADRLHERAGVGAGEIGADDDRVEVREPVEQVHADVPDRRVADDHHQAGTRRLVGEVELGEVTAERGAHLEVGHGATVDSPVVRIVVARCQVDYAGRLTAHLPLATRVLMLKSDGSVLIHSDGGSYKPLNWMSPPCTVKEGVTEDGRPEWVVTAGKTDDTLRILIDEVLHDTSHDLGVDPGLQKDGVEKHLQELLAEHPATLSDGLTLVRREYMTAIGPVDLMCRDADGLSVAVEIKRRGEIDGVEQLTRYLDLLNRDPALTRKGAVRGIFAAQEIKPQARVLATDRGIACALVDYDALRGMDDGAEHRLF